MKLAQHKLSRRLKFRGLDVSIETDEGEVRRWHDASTGEEGKTKMSIPYGYIRRTEGVDGDHVDVFIGPHEDAENVYVIHQRKAPDFKTFDEDKCMLGFNTADEAKAAYKNHYNDDRFFGSMSVLPFEKFKTKVLATFENPRKIAMPLGLPSPTGPLSKAFQDATLTHKLVAAGIPLAALGGGAAIGQHAAGDRVEPGAHPAVRGAVGGLAGTTAGLAGGYGLSQHLRRALPGGEFGAYGHTMKALTGPGRAGSVAALGALGLLGGAYLGGRSAQDTATPVERLKRALGMKTGMAPPKTLSESVHEADDISRELRRFARRHPPTPGTESTHNLASKSLDDLPAKAAGWYQKLFGGAGTSTVEQNYGPAAAARARSIEQAGARAPAPAAPAPPIIQPAGGSSGAKQQWSMQNFDRPGM
jgi:hypothetical protein